MDGRGFILLVSLSKLERQEREDSLFLLRPGVVVGWGEWVGIAGLCVSADRRNLD